MITATKKWIFLKISGALLVPLMIWFILNLIKIYDQDNSNLIVFFSSRRRHTRLRRDWSSDVCSSDLFLH